MKIRNLIIGFGILASIMAVNPSFAQAPQMIGGPGIAVSGSANQAQLPQKAKSFIDKHFKGVDVRSIEKNFIKGSYDVDLSNGVEIEFDSAGNVKEIDAAKNSVLSATLVKDVMHSKAYKHLEKAGMAGKVESIEFNKKKVCSVELKVPEPDTYLYDVNGVFIAIVD